MYIIFDSANSRWADNKHTCLFARVKTSDGWQEFVCHQYSTGFEKEIWECRDDFTFLPSEEEQSEDAIVKLVQDAIQKMLDEKAREKLYDDSNSLVSYTTSTNETFRDEATRFNKWRDDCWAISWQIFNDYKAGNRPKPTFSEVMSKIPTFTWETENTENTEE